MILVEAVFERELINTEKDVLYSNKLVEIMRWQIHVANVDEDTYFQPRRIQNMDGAVHHAMDSKLFLNLYNERKMENVFYEGNCGVE